MQQLALASVALSLTSKAATTDIVLGVPFVNRRSNADNATVGLFLEPLPVRVKVADEEQVDFVGEVRGIMQTVLANTMPLHQLLDLLDVKPDYPDHPLFDIMVTFHEQHMRSELSMGVAGMEPHLVWSQGAKFKLMLEFVAVSDSTITLRAEYDNECVDLAELRQQLRDIPRCMGLLASGLPCAEVKSQLAEGSGPDGTFGPMLDDQDLFGARICDL